LEINEVARNHLTRTEWRERKK